MVQDGMILVQKYFIKRRLEIFMLQCALCDFVHLSVFNFKRFAVLLVHIGKISTALKIST